MVIYLLILWYYFVGMALNTVLMEIIFRTHKRKMENSAFVNERFNFSETGECMECIYD